MRRSRSVSRERNVDAHPAVERSFHAFVGADGYALTGLRGDLNRFATLLGGDLEIPAQHIHAEPF